MRRAGWAALACGVLVAAACSGSDAATPSPDATETTTPITDPPDSVLRVGVVLPLTGEGSEIGTSMADAIKVAKDEINEAGGVSSRAVDVEVLDEAMLDDTAATPSLDELFIGEIDAVIGPASALVAARLLPITTEAGVLTCSPTASAMSLDDFPDQGPLFIRTIPSDSLQAKALARQIDSTGATQVVLAYVDDAFGLPFADAVQTELEILGDEVVERVPFDPTDVDFTDEARTIRDAGARAIGLVGDPDAGPRLVQSLSDVLDPAADIDVWMNDAMRVPATANAYRRLPETALARMHGVSPQSLIADPAVAARLGDSTGSPRYFAANAYDCMNVIALAANAAQLITGSSMADQIADVTTGGTSCASFPACDNQLRAERSIDYDGPNGALDLGGDGDPITGVFDVFDFDRSGVDRTVAGGTFRVN